MNSTTTRTAIPVTASLRQIGRCGLMFLLGCLAAPAAHAHSGFAVDVRGGYNAEKEEGLLGGGVLTGIAPSWDFNPNVEWTMVPNGSYFTVNGDFHHDFSRESAGPAIWLGAGPALAVWRNDGGPDDTRFGLNLFGGVGAARGEVRPYGQAKVMISDTSEFSAALGLRF